MDDETLFFIEDNLTQRRRQLDETPFDSEKGALINAEWSKEAVLMKKQEFIAIQIDGQWFFASDLKDLDPYGLKKIVLMTTTDFPKLPVYFSIFAERIDLTNENSVHLSDYEKAVSSLKSHKNLYQNYKENETNQISQKVEINFPEFLVDISSFKRDDNHSFNETLSSSELVERNNYNRFFNRWLEQVILDRQTYFEYKKEEYKEYLNEWNRNFTKDKIEYLKIVKAYREKGNHAIGSYISANLNSILLPSWFNREMSVDFISDQRILLLEMKLPNINDEVIYKDKLLRSGKKLVPANQKESNEFREKILYFYFLRFIWEIPRVDYDQLVESIAGNAYMEYHDPATGQLRKDVIMSIVVSSKELLTIDLAYVNPAKCFKKLKGVSGSKITDLIPIKPLIQFTKDENRFIKGYNVIENNVKTNLAAMDWQVFEQMIRELFEKEFGSDGAEVRITQASRDKGVDSIAYDPDPIKGGKYVIQAKRYTNTVDVSAVRDLYGTVLNEGANRGILVTTSHFGGDSYEFAKDKPITLLDGANLLHLLEKHGYKMRIDIAEARLLMNK